MAACSLARKCVHCHIALNGNSLIFNSESVYIVSSKLLVMCRTAMEVKLCHILCKVRGDFVQCPKSDSSWRPSAILLWFRFSANSADNVWRVCKNVMLRVCKWTKVLRVFRWTRVCKNNILRVCRWTRVCRCTRRRCSGDKFGAEAHRLTSPRFELFSLI